MFKRPKIREPVVEYIPVLSLVSPKICIISKKWMPIAIVLAKTVVHN